MNEELVKQLNIDLSTCKIPFTYDRASLVRNTYYDDKNFEIHVMFENFNETNTNHRNVLNCYDGNLSQIMFKDNGYPGASINFDREMLPPEAIEMIKEIASQDAIKDENNKKANI